MDLDDKDSAWLLLKTTASEDFCFVAPDHVLGSTLEGIDFFPPLNDVNFRHRHWHPPCRGRAIRNRPYTLPS